MNEKRTVRIAISIAHDRMAVPDAFQAQDDRKSRVEIRKKRPSERLGAALVNRCHPLRHKRASIPEMVRESFRQHVRTDAGTSIIVAHAAADADIRCQFSDGLSLNGGYRRGGIERHVRPIIGTALRGQSHGNTIHLTVRIGERRHLHRDGRPLEVAHDLRTRRGHTAAGTIVRREIVEAWLATDIPLSPL